MVSKVNMNNPHDRREELVWVPKSFSTTADFIAAVRADYKQRFAAPTTAGSIFIGFDAVEHIDNQIRWRNYQRHPWVSAWSEKAFCLVTSRGIPELWVHRDLVSYADCYRQFLTDVVGVSDAATGLAGFDVDHLYSRARAREKDTAEFMLLLPTVLAANRSHGYLESVRAKDIRPPKSVSTADFVVFLKILGLRAPSLRAGRKFDAESFIDQLKAENAIPVEEGEYDAILVGHLVEQIREASRDLQAKRRASRKKKP